MVLCFMMKILTNLRKKELKFPHTGSSSLENQSFPVYWKIGPRFLPWSQPFAQQQARGVCSKPDLKDAVLPQEQTA